MAADKGMAAAFEQLMKVAPIIIEIPLDLVFGVAGLILVAAMSRQRYLRWARDNEQAAPAVQYATGTAVVTDTAAQLQALTQTESYRKWAAGKRAAILSKHAVMSKRLCNTSTTLGFMLAAALLCKWLVVPTTPDVAPCIYFALLVAAFSFFMPLLGFALYIAAYVSFAAVAALWAISERYDLQPRCAMQVILAFWVAETALAIYSLVLVARKEDQLAAIDDPRKLS